MIFIAKFHLMGNVNDRIIRIYNYYNFKSYAEFAKHTDLSHQTVSNYLKGKQRPDVEKLSIIQQSFDNISASWLLSGQGDMLLSPSKKNLSEDALTYESESSKNKNLQNLNMGLSITIPRLIDFLLNNNNKLLESEIFRKYIRMNMDTILTMDDNKKKK